MNIGKSIKIMLIRKEQTQEQLAIQLGMSRQQVNHYANSERAGVNRLQDLAFWFGMSVSEFIKVGEK